MDQEKYEKLLEKLTAAVISLDGHICGLSSEIHHISKLIEAAENSAKSGGKQCIEKRG